MKPIMKWNLRTICLLLTALALSGCAHSDYSTSAGGQRTRRGIEERRNPHIPMEEPPKILPQTYFAAGQLLERQGQVEQALLQYRKALAVNHGFVAAQHRTALLLSVLGRRQEALEAFQKAVALKPDNPVLRNNLGYELMLHERWSEAVVEFSRSIELDSDFVRPYINRGLALSKLGRFDEALASFQRVLPPADAHYNVGLMYRAHRRYQEAAGSFQHVLSLNPQFTAATTQLEQLAPRLEQLPGVEPISAAVSSEPFPTLIALEDSISPVASAASESTTSSGSEWGTVTSVARSVETPSSIEPEYSDQDARTVRSATTKQASSSAASSHSAEPTRSAPSSSGSSSMWANDSAGWPSSKAELAQRSWPLLPLSVDVSRFERAYQPEYAGPLSLPELIASLSIVRNEIRCLEEAVQFGYSDATDADVDFESVLSNASIAMEYTSSAYPAIESAADSESESLPSRMTGRTSRGSIRSLGMTVIEEKPSKTSRSDSLYDFGPTPLRPEFVHPQEHPQAPLPLRPRP